MSLVLAMVLISVLGGLVQSSVSRLTRSVWRADAIHALGLTRHVLSTELRAGLPEDRAGLGPGRIGLRAFRATATVCPTQGGDSSLVAWVRGDREADPAKDSVLVLTGSGRWQAVDLVARSDRGESCAASGVDVETWTVSEPVDEPVLARAFESGIYTVDRGALRYTRGRGGEQPLTPAVYEEGAARSVFTGSGVLVEVVMMSAPWDSLSGERHFMFRSPPMP